MSYFNIACAYGIVRYMEVSYNNAIKDGTPIDIHDQNDALFLSTIRSSNPDAVVWLYRKAIEEGKPFDLHTRNDFFMKVACVCFHTNIYEYMDNQSRSCIAETLYDLSVEEGNPYDLHKDNDVLFERACMYKNYDLIDWILKKCDESPIKIQNLNQKIINSAFHLETKGNHVKQKILSFYRTEELNTDLPLFRKEYEDRIKNKISFFIKLHTQYRSLAEVHVGSIISSYVHK